MRGGFTLIELLVVLVIMGLAAALVMPSLGRTPSTEMKAAAQSLAAGLRWTRSQAMAHERPATLTLDVDEHWFRLAGQNRERALPSGLQLALYTAQSELSGDARGAIRFFPDGSSTGGRITLSSDKAAYFVDVDWLTGKVRLFEGAPQGGRDEQ